MIPVALLAAQTAGLLGGCESTSAADEDVMTQAEANAFSEGLYDGSLLDLEKLLAPADPEVALPGVPIPVELVIPCTGGGEAAFLGNATVTVDESDMTSSGSSGWAQGTRMGSCVLDNVITAEASATDPAPTATVEGSVCGLTVDRIINLGIATS